MIEIKRILCPVDFSEFSRYALDYAVAMARWYEAHVTALHVFTDWRDTSDQRRVDAEEESFQRLWNDKAQPVAAGAAHAARAGISPINGMAPEDFARFNRE